MSQRNRLANVTNPFQGNRKRVLCMCSAGLLRSPTAAAVLSQEPFRYNTRSAGVVTTHALIPVDDVLLAWADEVVVMESWQKHFIKEDKGYSGPIVCLDIEDSYDYMDPSLCEQILDRYTEKTGGNNEQGA